MLRSRRFTTIDGLIHVRRIALCATAHLAPPCRTSSFPSHQKGHIIHSESLLSNTACFPQLRAIFEGRSAFYFVWRSEGFVVMMLDYMLALVKSLHRCPGKRGASCATHEHPVAFTLNGLRHFRRRNQGRYKEIEGCY